MGKVIVVSDLTFEINVGHIIILDNDNPPSEIIELTGFSIVNRPISIYNSVQLSISYTPVNTTQKGVTWNSSDENIATVSNTGYVIVKKAGSVSITATSTYNNTLVDNFTATCSTTQIPVTSIALNGTNTGKTGEVIQLSVSVLPSNATNKGVTWNSSDENIATVSNTGLVTLKSEGNVIITATSISEKSISESKSIDISNVVTDSAVMVLSMRPYPESNSLESDSEGRKINRCNPSRHSSMKDVDVVDTLGNKFGTIIREAGSVVGKYIDSNMNMNEAFNPSGLSGNLGKYEDVFLTTAHHGVPNKKAGFRIIVSNGTYKVRILPCWNGTSPESNTQYNVNELGPKSSSVPMYHNTTIFVEFENVVVVDDALDVYVTTSYSPITLIEITKI